jgi:hypothetical protein
MSAEHGDHRHNIMNMSGGKITEYISSVRENTLPHKNLTWKQRRQIDKVKPEDKNIKDLNGVAEIGEQIFDQEFKLPPNTELSSEIHTTMRETIGVPENSQGVDVQVDLFFPVTRRQETVLLQSPGDKVVIPAYTVHKTFNKGDFPVTLTAQGVKVLEGSGGTIKNPEIKDIFDPHQ